MKSKFFLQMLPWPGLNFGDVVSGVDLLAFWKLESAYANYPLNRSLNSQSITDLISGYAASKRRASTMSQGTLI